MKEVRDTYKINAQGGERCKRLRRLAERLMGRIGKTAADPAVGGTGGGVAGGEGI
jgi:hypothetical protein